MNSEKQYIDLYKQCRNIICSHSADVMNNIRDKAFEAFCRNGFPSKKVERYKYTDVQELFAPKDYGLNLERLPFQINPEEVFKCDVPNLSTQLYFVINDMFYDNTSKTRTLPEGVYVGSLCEAAKKYPELIEKYYGKLASSEDDSITALNTMLAQDGLLVYVPKGVKVEQTIQVINVMRSNVNLMTNRRVLIIVEPLAEVKLLFCDHNADKQRFLTTQVIETFVEDNAHLELYCLEETHLKNVRFSNLYIDQGRNSFINHNAITLHNGVTRNRTDLVFSGEGSDCELLGCVIADKEQHVDNNTLIDHKVGHCTSKELYKYVLDDKAVGAFAGKILVRHGAQQSYSHETNQNLCATKEARMFTQPMLEIYADDVKCDHGSTVGQLNDEALFYMQQRGISLKEARMLLKFAFLGQVIDHIKLEPLRTRLHMLVEKRFRGELGGCRHCHKCSK